MKTMRFGYYKQIFRVTQSETGCIEPRVVCGLRPVQVIMMSVTCDFNKSKTPSVGVLSKKGSAVRLVVGCCQLLERRSAFSMCVTFSEWLISLDIFSSSLPFDGTLGTSFSKDSLGIRFTREAC